MKKFAFKLESVLKLRKNQEEQQQRIVAGIEMERRKLEEGLRGLQESITSTRSELQNDLVGRIETQALRWHAAATMQSMRQAQRAVLELAGVHRKLESARKELLEATRRRRAIELLRESRYRQWQSDQNRGETEFLDEMSMNAAFNREREST